MSEHMGNVFDMKGKKLRDGPPNYRTVPCCFSCSHGKLIPFKGIYCTRHRAFEREHGLCDNYA